MFNAHKLIITITAALCYGLPSIAQELKPYQESSSNKYGYYGYKDESGNVVIQPKFHKAYSFSSNGLAMVELERDRGWGYIDITGDFAIQPKYYIADDFSSNGLARVKLYGSKWGYIDKTGEFVIQPKFDEAHSFSSNGLAMVKIKSSGAWGYIDKTGKFVIKPKYYIADDFSSNGLACVWATNDKHGYIDKTGKFVIQPKFDHAYSFADNGLARVELNGKWGCINETGAFVVKPQFDFVYDFSDNGLAQVRLTVEFGYIDESGEFYSTKEQAFAAIENYKVKSGESHADYISRFAPSWKSFLQTKGFTASGTDLNEIIKHTIESSINTWQKKGEFESTADWQQRVTDDARAAKVTEVTDSIQRKLLEVKSEYEAECKKYSDKYCSEKAKEFAKQTFELKPYDADNETFLISSKENGDILLPVPKTDAQQFKTNWSSIKSSVKATFVPTGNDVALKSVTFGNYTYDGNTKANYAVTTVDYNFAPIEISNMDLASADYNFDQISSAPTVTVSNPDAKTITTTKVKPETKRVVAGNASDVDVNIPKGSVTAKNTFAVVIANENYQNAERVDNAANDGKVMAKYLNQTFGIPEKQIFAYTDASFGNMLSALDKLKNYASAYAGSDFNVLFYYAGHGVPDEDSHEAYLMPVDGIPGNPAVNISLTSLYEKLGALGASSVCVMLDACFSGAQRGDGMLALARGVTIKAKNAEPQGNMVVLSAAQGNETAYPYREKSHGMFTYFLLKKLQETAGNVTLGELSDYVIDNVRKTSIVENNGKLQTPTVAISASATSSWRSRRLAR
jgi:hypothetical protein